VVLGAEKCVGKSDLSLMLAELIVVGMGEGSLRPRCRRCRCRRKCRERRRDVAEIEVESSSLYFAIAGRGERMRVLMPLIWFRDPVEKVTKIPQDIGSPISDVKDF
jgi:hypothetical protein